MIRALPRAALLPLASGALLLSLDCGIARAPQVDHDSSFLDCTKKADCSGVAGATCAQGWCVDVETGDRINSGALEDTPLDHLRATCTVSDQLPNPPIEDQAALNRLEGCETIYGHIDLTFAADLRALHALHKLVGTLTIRPEDPARASLEGLENLELVTRGLELKRLAARSLTSLAGLRSVGSPPEGGLWLENSAGLRDLSGLERLASLTQLILTDLPDLVSIDALRLPARLDWIALQDLPRMSSAEALRSVASVDTLILSNTGLQDLDMLEHQTIRSLRLANNSRLSDAAGLAAVEELELIGNALLSSLELPARINGLRTLQVSANPALYSITGLEQLPFLDALMVQENPALALLRLPGLQTLRQLDVRRNPRLTSIDLPLLIEPVQNLVVVSNASLSPASLFSLANRALKAKLAGNRGEPSGLDPCPYQRDGYCDAAPVDSLCARGTDPFDCAN